MRHLTTDELDAGIPLVEASPSDGGIVDMIVRRPEVDGREVVDEGERKVEVGGEEDEGASRCDECRRLGLE